MPIHPRAALNTSITFVMAVSVLPTACTLLSLDDFTLVTCTQDSDCEPLNSRHGIAAEACLRYRCAPSARKCSLPVAGPESCDGADNDCNGVIDDGVIAPGAPARLAAYAANIDGVSYATHPSGGVVASYTLVDSFQGAFASFAGRRGAAGSVHTLTYARQAADRSLTMPALTDGCPGSSADCNVADLALAPVAATGSFAVAVNRSGCDAGQLRIGFIEENGAQLALRGPSVRSNVYLGVDRLLPPDPPCSGASRRPTLGAARPSIAALGQTGSASPQALALWLGASLDRPDCGGAAVNVEALGLWMEGLVWAGATIRAVTGSNGGAPQVLGRTSGGGRPAVVALPGDRASYAVAFATETGGLVLRHVPALPSDLPALDRARFDDATYADSTRPTPSLIPGDPFDVPRSSTGPVDHVALAVGAPHDGLTDLGVVWQEGCGMSESSVWFAEVRIDTSTSMLSTGSPPVRVSVDRGANTPSLAYVDSGFVRTGYTRDGASAGPTGGWVVAWVDASRLPNRLLARRLLALDGRPVDEPPIDLAPGARAPRSPVVYGASDATGGALAYAFNDRGQDGFFGGVLACGAAGR